MADRKHVANRDGPFKTNKVTVEDGFFLAPGYDLKRFDQQEVGATGHHKVLGVFPSNEQSPDPRFLARWDEKDRALDFDLVDREDKVLPAQPHGHHSTPQGDRRFEVELGRDENSIVFEGIVAVALGFKAGLEPGKYTWG